MKDWLKNLFKSKKQKAKEAELALQKKLAEEAASKKRHPAGKAKATPAKKAAPKATAKAAPKKATPKKKA